MELRLEGIDSEIVLSLTDKMREWVSLLLEYQEILRRLGIESTIKRDLTISVAVSDPPDSLSSFEAVRLSLRSCQIADEIAAVKKDVLTALQEDYDLQRQLFKIVLREIEVQRERDVVDPSL